MESNKLGQHFIMDYFKFNRDALSRITRQSDNLRPPFVKLESTKKAFFLSWL